MRKTLLIAVCATAMMMANTSKARCFTEEEIAKEGLSDEYKPVTVTDGNGRVISQACKNSHGNNTKTQFIYGLDEHSDRIEYAIELPNGTYYDDMYDDVYNINIPDGLIVYDPESDRIVFKSDTSGIDESVLQYMQGWGYKYVYDENGNLTEKRATVARYDPWEYEGFYFSTYNLPYVEETYENEDGKIIAYDSDGNKIGEYASVTSMLQGEALPETPPETTHLVQNADGSTTIYNADGSIKGFKGKRIYTVQEAEMLSKETGNTFKIRYK